MKKFTKEQIDKIINNKIDNKTLFNQYPEFKDMVIKEFAEINKGSNSDEIATIINRYKTKARLVIRDSYLFMDTTWEYF